MFLLMSLILIMINFIFLMVSNPMSMGLTIIMQTFLIAIFSGMNMPSFWYSYILVMVFLGGLLVLFVYMATLASNEKMNISLKPLIMTMPIFLTILFILYSSITPSFSYTDNFSYNPSFQWMFSVPLFILTLFLMIYLLIVLIAIVKITKWWGGSLRPM